MVWDKMPNPSFQKDDIYKYHTYIIHLKIQNKKNNIYLINIEKSLSLYYLEVFWEMHYTVFRVFTAEYFGCHASSMHLMPCVIVHTLWALQHMSKHYNENMWHCTPSYRRQAMTNISMILLENCWIISVQLCWNYVFVMKFNISVRKNTYITNGTHTQKTLNIAYTRHTETEETAWTKIPFQE